ncbi:hypothetical protein BCR33DRAFT_765219 [Rhizoclosmatium globosum]|uniref:Uncharacterized protein n=1 Tax=Rhizoclosmatium globosum TaxID=329046 RepID=A0A1Y2CG40_9FUNG|nr:hypothetical protein BCR33DRAFT_765219 [Rhizoclosmatium globosum]|eukprot:ORY45999.1 hypothetical protein BCR33DRAFT_765219 [Rhizoclosmatium globosum]
MAGVEDLDDDYLLTPFREPQSKKKRTRDQVDNDPEEVVERQADLVEEDALDEETTEAPLSKKSKKKKKNKPAQPPQEKQPKKPKDRSAKTLELRKEIFELANASEWSDESVEFPEERSLENLLTLVTAMREVEKKTILIVTPSAERAIAIIPVMKPLGKIGKLFTRHMKVEEQIAAQKTHKFPVSVGSASRIVKLVEAGAITPKEVGFVILDGTSFDKKQRTLFDIPELKADLVELLKLMKSSNVIVF